MTAEQGVPLRPIGDRIVIQRDTAEQQTEGGIVLPERSQTPPTEGRVVAVGSGRLLISGERAKMEVAVGDRVMFRRGTGVTINHGGTEFIVMQESEVLCVVWGS